MDRQEFDNFETALKNNNQFDGTDNYEDFQEQEEYIPPSNLQFTTSDSEPNNYNNASVPDTADNGVNSDNVFHEKPRPSLPKTEDDFEIFDNGPLKSEIDSWKNKYGDVWIVDDLPIEQTFVYRDLTRYEYKSIVAMQNTDALMREEAICEICVLFPYEFTYGEMSNSKAGIPTLLASHIMETSGFTKASMPRRL